MRFLLLLCFAGALASCQQDSPDIQQPGLEVVTVSETLPNDSRCPRRIKIVPDVHHTEHVGKTADGRQFWITTPFEAAIDGPGREYLAVFLWNADGSFREARIVDLGPRAQLKQSVYVQQFKAELKRLGEIKRTPINVSPFRFERFGTEFGLIYSWYENSEWVILLPGDVVAFTPPWNGDYDT